MLFPEKKIIFCIKLISVVIVKCVICSVSYMSMYKSIISGMSFSNIIFKKP